MCKAPILDRMLNIKLAIITRTHIFNANGESAKKGKNLHINRRTNAMNIRNIHTAHAHTHTQLQQQRREAREQESDRERFETNPIEFIYSKWIEGIIPVQSNM